MLSDGGLDGRKDGLQTNRQTDMRKLTVAIGIFSKTPIRRSCVHPVVELKYLAKRQMR